MLYSIIYNFVFSLFQTEIAKRLNAIIAQILPFLSQEHQQQVATAVERAKQVTMTELNAIIGVSSIIHSRCYKIYSLHYVYVAILKYFSFILKKQTEK